MRVRPSVVSVIAKITFQTRIHCSKTDTSRSLCCYHSPLLSYFDFDFTFSFPLFFTPSLFTSLLLHFSLLYFFTSLLPRLSSLSPLLFTLLSSFHLPPVFITLNKLSKGITQPTTTITRKKYNQHNNRHGYEQIPPDNLKVSTPLLLRVLLLLCLFSGSLLSFKNNSNDSRCRNEDNTAVD